MSGVFEYQLASALPMCAHLSPTLEQFGLSVAESLQPVASALLEPVPAIAHQSQRAYNANKHSRLNNESVGLTARKMSPQGPQQRAAFDMIGRVPGTAR